MEERKSPERDDCARVSGELLSGCWQVCGQGVVMVLGLWLGWGLLSAGVAFKLRNTLRLAPGCKPRPQQPSL